jgi:hypothetical protein
MPIFVTYIPAELMIKENMGMKRELEDLKVLLNYYDTHLNMTLKELSQMTGKTIAELKKIILS